MAPPTNDVIDPPCAAADDDAPTVIEITEAEHNEALMATSIARTAEHVREMQAQVDGLLKAMGLQAEVNRRQQERITQLERQQLAAGEAHAHALEGGK